MTTDIAVSDIERVLVGGDLKALTDEQRLRYYQTLCASLGLNPLTRPFEYLTLQGKLILYARKDATEQLRNLRGVSITRLDREIIGDVYVVTATGHCNGRTDMATGAVAIKGVVGEALANAYLKAETKAKRRLTLSICGLGVLDETEVEDIPAEQPQLAPRQQRALPAATITESPAVTQAVDAANDRKKFFAQARELGYTKRSEIHPLFGLPPSEPALNEWVAEGRSWAEALETLKTAHAQRERDAVLAPDVLPFETDAEPEIVGFDDDGNPIQAEQPTLMPVSAGHS